MEIRSENFIASSAQSLQNVNLQDALERASDGFINKRVKAISSIKNFEELREQGSQIKHHTIKYLGHYLEEFEKNATSQGAHVHWAQNGDELNQLVLEIAKRHKVKKVTKGKSMVSEETELGKFLESAGIKTLETDLGEYILQLAKEKPSHIVAPAVHKTRAEVTALFKEHHNLGERDINEPVELVAEARQVLRGQYLESDLGITGANFLIADKGAMLLITNEGNGDLSASLPPVHVVTVGIEKLVPSLDDAWLLMRLLTNNATGQRVTCYSSLLAGAGTGDNPQERHFILLDNERSKIYNSEYRSMLQCIRCGACMNHCPVYSSIGGEAYGSVYPGPMGAILTPLMADANKAKHLPNASSLCGRCVEVCPVKIPLTDLLRKLREDNHSFKWRSITRAFAFITRHPWLYKIISPIINLGMRIALLIRVTRY